MERRTRSQHTKIIRNARRSSDRRRDWAVKSTTAQNLSGLAEVQQKYEEEIAELTIDALEPHR